jgi:AraC-like DNA-binding protein
MAIDVLQDVLDTIRLHGVIAGVHTFAAPWGYATTPDSQDIAFLVMVAGGGILEVEEGDLPVRTLQSGDIVVLPRGTRYMLRDTVHSPTRPFTELTELQTQRQGAVGTMTRIASGCYRFVDISKKPVFSVLPPLIHLRKEDYQPMQELDLLVRLFATQTLESASGWLRGLADPPIAAALQAIHANPAAQWTVARLASEAHLSRSAFAGRFKAMVGEPPMQYVQRWRMQRAAHYMDAGNLPLKTIIAMSGYASEAAFRKAFHQWIGMLPSQYQAHTG